eukprot:1096-Amorphochlora_amoeboformis.AAC.1
MFPGIPVLPGTTVTHLMLLGISRRAAATRYWRACMTTGTHNDNVKSAGLCKPGRQKKGANYPQGNHTTDIDGLP